MARKLLGLVLMLLAGVPQARGQSLAEAAQKERERREKAKASGTAAKPVTEDELAQAKGRIANDPNQVASVVSPAGASTTSPARAGAAPEASRTNEEAIWRGRYSAAKTRLDNALKRQLQMQLVLHAGQAPQQDASGRKFIYAGNVLKDMADAADAEVAAAQKAMDDLAEEGRRAGALPGWFR
jgi:hypothetical protein